METRLRRRIQELGYSDFREFYRHLQVRGRLDREWATLIDRLTIHETRFFRHPPSFALLRERLLPAMKRLAVEGAEFVAWSVGCATGEEPYSLAMALDEHYAIAGCGREFRVLASDISLPALNVARQGIYAKHKIKEIPPPLRLRYTRRLADGRYQITEDLRRRVHFVQANVLRGGHAAWGRVDLIQCQNMLIYFAHEQRVEILERLIAHLMPGGNLILGPGEVLHWSHPEMERVAFPNTLAFCRATNDPAKTASARAIGVSAASLPEGPGIHR